MISSAVLVMIEFPGGISGKVWKFLELARNI